MESVIAKGYKDGHRVTVEIIKRNGTLDVLCSDFRHTDDIRGMLHGTIIVGGTYPAPAGSLLKAYYCAEQYLDSVEEITVNGEIEEIPYEEGVIY